MISMFSVKAMFKLTNLIVFLTLVTNIELAFIQNVENVDPDFKWEDTNWDFENGDDKYLSDGDHILLKKDCEGYVPEGHVRYKFKRNIFLCISHIEQNVFFK